MALARDIAALAAPGDVIALFGDLGTGKTLFARAFINALPRPGTAGAGAGPGAGEEREMEEVPSPTFTLLQTYERAPAPVWHFDLYRLEHPEEVYELGFEEALGQAIALIEWPERLGPLLPPARLDVRLSYAGPASARLVELAGGDTWAARLETLGRHD